MSRLTEIIVNLGCKLGEIFQTVYGWIAAAGIFVLNFFAGYETAINAVVICVALDTVWGIAAQIKRGHFALSELGRHGMLSKLALYASVIVGFVLLERMANLESQLAVIAICTLICLVELWSMGGSALIVNPKMRFLRIFREVLAGEVARKMQVPVDEAKKYLDGSTGKLTKN